MEINAVLSAVFHLKSETCTQWNVKKGHFNQWSYSFLKNQASHVTSWNAEQNDTATRLVSDILSISNIWLVFTVLRSK